MKKLAIYKLIVMALLLSLTVVGYAQGGTITGKVSNLSGEPLDFSSVAIEGTSLGTSTDENGDFTIANVPAGDYKIVASFLGYETNRRRISLKAGEHITIAFTLAEAFNTMDEVVVTGTLKEVSRLDSPVPVEVYNPAFFKKNPTPNIYEALQNVNGVRPQWNCQVRNPGDIHINGLEGPYTMVLIDGMPIVSSLATV